MTHSDHPQRHPRQHGPKRREDATRPSRTRSGTRRGGDLRPYPTAPTTTRLSPAKPGTATTRTRSRGSATTPTPATVWACGPTPIDPKAAWPPPIIATIVGTFSKPGDRVVVLPWPGSAEPPSPTPVGPDGVIDRAPGTATEDDPASAAEIIDNLDRRAQVIHFPADSSVTAPPSEPFWAGLVSNPDRTPPAITTPPRSDLGDRALKSVNAESATTDLIITSLRPQDGGDHSGDLVALLAARLLRVGGILAVLTHCDWSRGELIDPTGAVVAAGQNADLLYLQHVVAVHAPVRDGQFAAALDTPAAEDEARSRHRAVVRGLPAPHRRIHSDVLVFAQPQSARSSAELRVLQEEPKSPSGGLSDVERRVPGEVGGSVS